MPSTKTVGEQLSILLRLQEIDAKIYALHRTKKAKPLGLEDLRKQWETEKQRVADAERALTELQVKRKNKEMDLESKEEAVKKYQVQLYQVKTNKEYQSLQKEIGTLKADNSVLEESILQIMEEVDQKKEDLSRKKEALAQTASSLSQEEARIADEIKEIDRELAALKEKRQAIIPGLGKTLFERYDKILIAKEGLALVPIEGNSCGGCYIHLPPQVINEVQLQEKIVICENCSRILYERGRSS